MSDRITAVSITPFLYGLSIPLFQFFRRLVFSTLDLPIRFAQCQSFCNYPLLQLNEKLESQECDFFSCRGHFNNPHSLLININYCNHNSRRTRHYSGHSHSRPCSLQPFLDFSNHSTSLQFSQHISRPSLYLLCSLICVTIFE